MQGLRIYRDLPMGGIGFRGLGFRVSYGGGGL